ncbi:MAG: hypothetical protein KGL40_05475 [Rhodocyclaceae bacterium]|nr:hypothetical protein [Rhodocyclaceae bacterium]
MSENNNSPQAAQELTAPLKTWGDFLPVALTFARKTIFVWPFFPGVLLWLYLQHIGRPDLFLPTLANPAGLSAFLIAFLLTGLLLILAILLPSIYFSVIQHVNAKDLGEETRKAAWRAIVAIVLGIFLGVAASSKYPQTSILFGITFAIAVYFIHLRYKHETVFEALTGGPKASRWKRLGWISYQSFFMVLGAMVLITPAFILYLTVAFKNDAWWAPLVSISIFTCFAFVTSIPAILYCSVKAVGGTEQRALSAFFAGVLILAYAVLFIAIPKTPSRVVESAATSMGIRDMTPRIYKVQSKKLSKEDFESANWAIVEDGKGKTKDSGEFKVVATVPLDLGGIVLLCPQVLADSEVLQANSSDMCAVFTHDEVARVPIGKEINQKPKGNTQA